MASKTMKALVHQADGTAGVKDIPVPVLTEHDVLVRTVAVALNPGDWKGLEYFHTPGNIIGFDFAGEVVQVGKAVSTVAIGDRVTGFVPGGLFKDRGAFAEYVPIAEDLVWKIPNGTSYEEASSLDCALWTAAQCLFHPTRLGLVEPPAKVDKEQWVFVNGGSSSVGQFAIQLLHLAGYKVVTVSSQSNFNLCTSLGADAVFDYHDSEYISKIKAVTGDTLHHAIDCISIPQTEVDSVKVLGPGSGKVMIVSASFPIAHVLRTDVTVQLSMVYTAAGLEFIFNGFAVPPIPEDRAHAVQFAKKIPALVEAGKLKPNPVQLLPGGLERIPEGFSLLKEDKVSGKKLVYRLSEGL